MASIPRRPGPRPAFVLAAALSLAAGCADLYGPPTTPVTGRVTLNGSPLADASVTFTPADGPASEGRTDASGRFFLVDPDGRPGAVVGRHAVRIVAGPGPGQPDGAAGYDSGTQLLRDVHPDGGELRFDLRSTVDAFNGRLVRAGEPIRFDGRAVLLRLTSQATGETFGVPIDGEGAFDVDWMPVGSYAALLARRDLTQTPSFPGLPGTFLIPDGVRIERGKTRYLIDLGENWSPDAFFADPVPARRHPASAAASRPTRQAGTADGQGRDHG